MASENKVAKMTTIKISELSNSYVATGFGEMCNRLEFFPTFHFTAPSEILRSNGMRVKEEAQIPDFLKGRQHGIWLPKIKAEYDLGFGRNNDVGASDAYGADRDDYISYVCSIKDIYLADGEIFDRVKKIEDFRAQNPELLYVEEKLLNCYSLYGSIIDVLMFVIESSYQDIVLYRFDDKNYLQKIFDINTRVEKSLISKGYETAKDVVSLTREQLITFDGIGRKSAEKIVEKIDEIKKITNE